MPPSPIPYFSAQDLIERIPMKKAISLMGEAFRQVSSGEAKVPVRTHVHMPEADAQSLFMPAYLASTQQFGIKIVGMNDHNPDKGLPFIHALVIVLDALTGKPLGIVDGTYLTALRTGAASGIATQLLAREDAQVMAIFGAGKQAFLQIEAIRTVRDLKKVIIFNRSLDKAEQLQQRLTKVFDGQIELAKSEKSLLEADIICTATSCPTPVFSHQHLKRGVHINAIGAYRSDMAEIPPETVLASSVFVDQHSACWTEAGDLIQPLEAGLIEKNHIKGEIGELVMRRISGRISQGEITLFKSVGNAAQDLAIAGALVAD